MLVEDIIDLYKLLGELIQSSGISPRDEIVTAMAFLLACRHHLVTACLAIERGHLTDPSFATRAAIEACAFANRINKQPQLGMIWLKAGDSKATYETYKREFWGRKKLFPDDEPLMAELGNRYDFLSRQTHTSLYSLCRRLKTQRRPDSSDMIFRYFEVHPQDEAEPARTFLYTIDTHIGIIKVFARILGEAIDHNRTKWEVHLNSVDAKIMTHKERWKPAILQRRRETREKRPG